MATDERLNEVMGFVRDFTRDEADAARSALGEPDDDRYLAARARAAAHCADGVSLVVDRFAVPGGRKEDADPRRAHDIDQRVLFAIVAGESATRQAWMAYVSELRDPEGIMLDQELSIAEVDGRLLIVGRRAANPFSDDLEWENAGGTPLDLDRVDEVRIEQLPLDPRHAEFLRQLAGE